MARNRLGWLDVATTMRPQLPDLAAFAAELAAEGYTHAVLLGMGGSSLAPEVLRRTFGVRPGALDLFVLDSTSPDAVRAMLEGHDPARTFVLVSSKSGGTIEVVTLEACAWEWMRAARGDGAALVRRGHRPRHFTKASPRGAATGTFCTNPADIGGRSSALSLFGLVPAALRASTFGAARPHRTRRCARAVHGAAADHPRSCSRPRSASSRCAPRPGHRHVQRESAAGRRVAIGAIAPVEQ